MTMMTMMSTDPTIRISNDDDDDDDGDNVDDQTTEMVGHGGRACRFYE